MNLRQRFDAVMQGRTPDAVAFFGDMTYWYGAHQTAGDLPQAWQGPRGIGRLHRDLRVGEYVPGCCAYRTTEGPDVRVERAATNEIIAVTWHTPVGSIRQVQQYSADSFSWGFIEHAVKSAADRIDGEYGDCGVPVIAVPGSPITELNKSWAGVMAMCYLMIDEPDETAATLEAIARSQDRLWEITADAACPYVMICENLSATTMGSYFESHIASYLRPRVDAVHARGKKCLIHIDGTLRGVIEKVHRLTGIDCIDAATPAPVGDVAVNELRELAGPDIIILGGLPGAMFAPPFKAADMEKHVREIIRCHKDSGKFMLGVADQVPPNGDLALVKLIHELVETHGRYA
jgi:hypothetical protein